jgi:uncharacterized protein (TIGR03435 family)
MLQRRRKRLSQTSPCLTVITMTTVSIVSATVAMWALQGPVNAQNSPARTTPFDAASVRVNVTHGPLTRTVGNGRLTYLNITLGEFIETAYGVKPYQVVAEKWVTDVRSSERYDIVAKAASPVPDEEVRSMLALLLAERFHLRVHRETQTLPIYSLVLAKGGPKRLMPAQGAEPGIYLDASGSLRYQNYSMEMFAVYLSGVRGVGRPVLNQTGLEGRYTFIADLLNLPRGLNAAEQKGGEQRLDGVDAVAFTALQEQLGLKLEQGRAPIEVLVVDHVDRVPTTD